MEFRIPVAIHAPAIARATVAGAAGPLTDEAAYALELVTSELVTNAIEHGHMRPFDDVIVRLHCDDQEIHVEVLSPGPGFDPPPSRLPQPQRLRENGYGLLVVDRLASSWGVESEGSRTKVWSKIPRAGGAASISAARARRSGRERRQRPGQQLHHRAI